MIIALADAVIFKKGAAPVGHDFDEAVQEFQQLPLETLTARYNKLISVDQETTYEVVAIDAEQDFVFRG